MKKKKILTCSKVNDDVNHEDSVAKAVEHDPSHIKIIVEEGNGHRQYNQVGHQQEQHAQIPVESANQTKK